MKCLEEDMKYVLEENAELCRKITLLEEKIIVSDHNRFDASIIQV